MNTNPNAKRILCFGDSNLWGRLPGDDNSARYPVDKRWPGILQNLLGTDYEVIEEGLNGRTTNRESPEKVGKNGAEYLFACLESHKPLDLVILSLGKNDLKAKYQATPEEIGRGVEECLQIIYKEGKTATGSTPKILLLSPSVIEEKPRLRSGKKVVDFLGGHAKSEQLGGIYQKIADKHSLSFLNLAHFAKASPIDGVHMDETMHRETAQAVFREAVKLLS